MRGVERFLSWTVVSRAQKSRWVPGKSHAIDLVIAGEGSTDRFLKQI